MEICQITVVPVFWAGRPSPGDTFKLRVPTSPWMGASHTSQPPPGTRCPTLGPWHTRSLCRRVCPPQTLSPAWPAQPEWSLLRGPLPAAWSHSSQLVAQFEVMSFCLCFFSLLLSPPGWTESPQESSVLALHGADGAHEAKLGSTAGRSRVSSGTRNTRPQTEGRWGPGDLHLHHKTVSCA